ncbi:MAG: ABC transporter substrate-binding protein [Sterolibacterium sp.]|jgi:NitT/TauT family transport system substrate-binding protein|nr:ABC transporter substrate-binding protein [Sterolibacterium sp.]
MRALSRRRFLASLTRLAGFAGFASLPLLPACGASRSRPFAVAAHAWPGYEPMFIASRQGWLDDKQVRLVETPSATSTLQALTSGIVDAGALTLDEVLRARAQGLALSVVLVFDESAGADMLLTQPGIETLAQLKGRRVAVEQGGLGALVLAQALQSAGLFAADVQPVSLAPVDQWLAWKNGEIDAAVTYPPYARRLLEAGAHRVFDSRQIPHAIVDVLAVRCESLEPHTPALRQLIAVYLRALSFMNQQFAEAAKLMEPRLQLPVQDLPQLFEGLKLPTLTENHRLLSGHAPLLEPAARQLSQNMLKIGLLPRESPLEGLVRGDFLPLLKGNGLAPA